MVFKFKILVSSSVVYFLLINLKVIYLLKNLYNQKYCGNKQAGDKQEIWYQAKTMSRRRRVNFDYQCAYSFGAVW